MASFPESGNAAADATRDEVKNAIRSSSPRATARRPPAFWRSPAAICVPRWRTRAADPHSRGACATPQPQSSTPTPATPVAEPLGCPTWPPRSNPPPPRPRPQSIARRAGDERRARQRRSPGDKKRQTTQGRVAEYPCRVRHGVAVAVALARQGASGLPHQYQSGLVGLAVCQSCASAQDLGVEDGGPGLTIFGSE